MLRLQIFLITLVICCAAGAQERWTAERANAWGKKTGWLVGCNYIPSSAINQLEMWQADSFDIKTIDRELEWAHGLGFNSVRVFLHNLLWQQDSAGFIKRMDKFLSIAAKHKIGVMFVLFDSCWDPSPQLGKQRAPKPHVHNSGWVQAPGKDILTDSHKQDSLKPYVLGILQHFRNDHRIHFWDLVNEPDNDNREAYGQVEPKDKPERGFELLRKVFGWAREVNPSQPLTAGIWLGDWSANERMKPMDKFIVSNSDIITFHNYDALPEMTKRLSFLQKYGRPLLCTEYMARPTGSTFLTILPFLKSEGVGAYNWGFVEGKTQTNYPWDSWKKKYETEPPVWFHEIFRKNGTAYRDEEVHLIRRQTGAGE